MKSLSLRVLLSSLILGILFAPHAKAQVDPNLEQGFKLYGSYHGGQIDTVNLQNGHLTVYAPFYSLPQRGGKLKLSYSVHYDNLIGTYMQATCAPPPSHFCTYAIRYFGTSAGIIMDQGYGLIKNLANSGQMDGAGNPVMIPVFYILGPDGAKHQLVIATDGHYETIDGSNLRFDQTNGSYLNPAGTLTDPSGIRQPIVSVLQASPPIPAGGTGFSQLEDQNGNQIASLDTLGRSLSLNPTTANISSCPQLGFPFQQLTTAVTWNFLAPNGGTMPVILCSANVYIRTKMCGLFPRCTEYSNNTTVLQSIVLPNGTYWAFQYSAANPNDTNSIAYGDLLKVVLPTGGSIAYSYTNTYYSCGPPPPLSMLYGAPQVATRAVDANDGTGPHSWTYSWSPNTTVTDPLGQKTVHTFSTTGGPCSLYETQTQFYDAANNLLKTTNTAYSAFDNAVSDLLGTDMAGTVVPIRTTTTWPNNQVTKTETDYDAGFTYRDPTYYWVLSNTLNSCQGGCVVNYGTYTSIYGKPIAVREYDYGTNAPGALLRQTKTNYLWQSNSNYLQFNLLNLPSSVTVYDGANNQKALTSYTYDGSARSSSGITMQRDAAPVNAPYFGNPTFVGRWENGSTVSTTNCPFSVTNANISTTTTFYDTGMPLTSTDACGHATAYSYSATFFGAFVTQTQYPDTNSPNLAHHIISGNYDFNTGLLTSFTDQNSNSKTFAYDNMQRFTTVTYPSPDGGTVNFYYPDGVTIEQQKQIDASRTTDLFVRFDGVGREIRRITANDESTPWDQVDTCYDSLGRASFKSYPYQGTGLSASQVCSGAGDAFVYDALGRTTTVTHSDNSTILTSYTGRATSVSDEGNGTQRVQRISQVDGLGRLASICEVASASQLGSGGTPAACSQDIAGTGFLTSYVYDTLDNLTSVAQGTLNSRTFQYDSLSRLTSATNPESGNITYAYDEDGLLITRTAPKPNQTSTLTVVTTMTYDPLHRLRGKSYNDSLTPTVTMNYDETSALGASGLLNTIGRSSSSTVAGSLAGEVLSYDKLGRARINSQCTPQNCGATTLFPVNYTYDLLGDMLTSTNGLGVTLTYTVNRATRLTTLASSLSDTNHPGTLYSSAHFNAAGSLLSANYGNGIAETLAYDSRLRLASITDGARYSVSIPTAPSGYAPNGDILTANDSVNGNWTYAYDAFNRIASANATGQAYTYVYDRYGNRWQQNGPHSSSLGFDNNNHITSGSGVTYDAAGNVTANGTPTYFYDAENRLIQVGGTLGVCSGATACYVYDASGRRIRKTTSSTSVDFLYDLAGSEVAEVSSTGGWNRGEVYAGGKHLATYSSGTGGTTYFIHADWLGTERARTTATGAAYETCTSLPFGDWLSCTGGDPSPMHFTGKEHDAESGLDNFGARYNASSMGRFMSPDPKNPSPRHIASPQKWNKYGYVLNNPLAFIDPDGLEEFIITVTRFIPTKVALPGAVGDGRKAGQPGTSRITQRVTIETDKKKNEGNSQVNASHSAGASVGINMESGPLIIPVGIGWSDTSKLKEGAQRDGSGNVTASFKADAKYPNTPPEVTPSITHDLSVTASTGLDGSTTFSVSGTYKNYPGLDITVQRPGSDGATLLYGDSADTLTKNVLGAITLVCPAILCTKTVPKDQPSTTVPPPTAQ
jgi:RHS repeat-associated protein